MASASTPVKRPAEEVKQEPGVAVKKAKAEPCARTVVHWFRTDLRLKDNTALAAASKVASSLPDANVVALFVVSPDEWKKHDVAPVRIDFWMRSLKSLKRDLQNKFGIPLVVARAAKKSEVPGVVARVAKELKAVEVTANIEYEVNEAARDAQTKKLLEDAKIKFTTKHDQCVVEPGLVRTQQGKVYTVFTPFKNSWIKHVNADVGKTLALSPEPALNRFGFNSDMGTFLESHDEVPEGADITPELQTALAGSDAAKDRLSKIRANFPEGEDVAHDRLSAKFIEKHIKQYQVERNLPESSAIQGNFAGSSRLSPYLSAGVISARQCVVAAREANHKKLDSGSDGCVTWISEIVWRDFYRNILVFFPRVCKNKAFKEDTEKVDWSYDKEKFQAWCEGRTGFPIVDAGMRQLNRDGWMHNRLRMVVAMFLTKDLLIDWRWGEKYFMENLIDGDFASNNGGWQWAASTGTDAQPYFRGEVSTGALFYFDNLFI